MNDRELKQVPLNILSTVGYLLMVAGIVCLLASRGLLSPHPVVILAQLAAVGLMIWARQTFGRRSFHLAANPTEGGLVTSGPYRYVRHPIYTSVMVFTWAGIGGNLSILNASFGAVTICGAFIRILCEEQLVRIRYPEYDAYASTTKRLIPFVF